VLTLTPPEVRLTGGVGPTMTCCEMKLVDIPDMNYFSTDKPHPRGEICARGPNIFVGYYKAEDKTRECLEPNGWFHTGDVGRLQPDGTVAIIDRKKNIFKLAQGEYVAAEKIENVYGRSPFVAQCFVYGDSLKSCLVAIVVPDPEVVAKWAADAKQPNDLPALCRGAALQKAVFDSMASIGKEAGLKGFELAKAIKLEAEPFSVDNGLLTPTFKLKRPQLKERFEPDIRALYAAVGEA
jgi:long-chain acyl-CoA synthetase